MKSVLLIGQSNMAGRGSIKEVEPIVHDHIFMLRNGRFQPMVEPLHNDRPNAGIGPAAAFALAWCKEHPGDTLGLIPCAEGGSEINEWMPEQPLFRHAISEAKFAMEQSELIAILWHQGENDSIDDRYKYYADRLDAIIQAMRKELSVPHIPFILGGLPDFLNQFGYGLYSPQYEKINEVLQKYADTHPDVFFVEGKGLHPNPDGIHIDAKSARRLGLRYYKAFSKDEGRAESEEKELADLSKLADRKPSLAEEYLKAQLDFIHGKISFDEMEKRIQNLSKQ